jgi:hypothetical protein
MATDDEVDRVEKKNESDNFQTRWRIYRAVMTTFYDAIHIITKIERIISRLDLVFK